MDTHNNDINSIKTPHFENLNHDDVSNFHETNSLYSDETLTPQMKLIDRIIDDYGYGFYIIKAIFIGLFINFLSSYVVNHTSSNYLIIKRNFSNIHNVESLLSYSSFFFKAIGSFSLVFLIKNFKRETLVLFSVIVLFFLNLLLSIYFNLITYMIFVGVGCFFAGLIDTINTEVLCEILPIRFRGFFMCILTIGSPLSQVTHFVIVNNFYDTNENNFKYSLMTGTFIIFAITFIVIFLFQDSPRNLLIREEEHLAYSILEKLLIDRNCLTFTEKEVLFNELRFGLNIKFKKELKSLFSEIFFKTTFIFMGLVLSVKCIDDGISSILTLYLQKILNTNDESKVAFNGIKVNSLGLLGPIFAGLLVEINFLGRKITLIITTILIILSFSLFHLNLSNFTLWLGFINVFCNASTSNLMTFITETYPTVVRDISQGYFNSLSGIGSLIGNIVFINLFKVGFEFPFYFQIINGFFAICLIILIKNETSRKPLDTFYHDMNNSKSEEVNIEEIKPLVGI